jgi:hypothetical protein
VCGVRPGGVRGNARGGLAATQTRCRGHGAWSPRTARPWRGRGVATAVAARGGWQGKARAKATGSGTARARGKGAHARTRVLASQGRGVAVPCAGHRHPGTAARCGGERAMAVAGSTSGAAGPCTRTAPRPEGRRGPRGCYGGFIGIAGSKG